MATLIIRGTFGDFATKGYLGDEIREFRPSVIKKFQEYFDLFHEVSEYAHQKKFDINIEGKDSQHRFAAFLFARVLTGTPTVCFLSTYGLSNDARVVLRSTLEALFILIKIVKEPSFVTQYMGSNEVNRVRMMNAARNARYTPPEIKDVEDELLDYLNKRVKEERFRELKACDIASSVGMDMHYDGMYRRLSNDVHVAAESLQPYLDSEIAGMIEWGPQFGGLATNLMSATDLLLRALNIIDGLFGMGMENELRAYRERLIKTSMDFDQIVSSSPRFRSAK
jgi:Family of unknown function (DUF5677)